MTLPILYSFRRCPYAMRARMGLLASGIAVELREVVLRDKPAEMLAASPKGTVPVLVLPDGGVIDESLDIMRWALAQSDPLGWLARDDAALIARNDGPFKQHLDRYKYPGRHGSDPAAHRAAGLAILSEMDARLAAGSKVGDRQLCGDVAGIADIATFPFIRQFAATDQAWFDAQPLPHLQRWLAGHIGSDLFARAMLRLPPWKAGDDMVVFGGR
ncbi:glutathione S-transferase [Sphingobium phenoxybenzoativorans]|uniref:Glutathione S-transferase n=1 Tax=Sphingobium phenoxybenzoativorans TaxID=1592790 RepID=A0A975K6U5_9SPHN|nr:glutathione S-transferase [Sphingobium phenoxybenzoativorans]QUT05881.1 glutathione S-transferase [Sphingobium phenoxybenzoativorans]